MASRSQGLIHKEQNAMMRLLKLSLMATAGLSIAASAVLAAPEHERLRGIVSAVSANEVTVRTATGQVSLSLSGSTVYLTSAHSTSITSQPTAISAWRPRLLATSRLALDVLIFPPPLKGAAEGHFPWDKLPDTTLAGGASTSSSMTNGSVAAVAQSRSAATTNSTMTNGSVAAASQNGGVRQLTVTYKGGEQTVLVPPQRRS
jgi:hypothetical protein